MDLQQTFYVLGIIFFSSGILIVLVTLGVVISLYYRYKRWLEESRRKVESLKRKVAAVPYLFSYFARKMRPRRGAKN